MLALYAVAKVRPFVNRGQVIYPGTVTPQLLAFASCAERAEWQWTSDRRQIAASQEFLGAHVFGARAPLLEQRGEETGFFAPHDWPPRVDGTWSAAVEQQASPEASQAGGDE
ncbi:hypothetical protein [Bradyrhizobium amphicarpaeae]|uniref:Uncharacterized protein n=1 Tax=Bradyrhizobium amphicarpaeae TaxID=1404768 RepID=A0A2U8Q3V6_9BRAD|nr:hypothetical protein [Bradyrhizobium amphicarpaeae]AWM03975.1 hypothetical protein CIT40_30725 [Bradyrhizobium amphicarpaeae]